MASSMTTSPPRAAAVTVPAPASTQDQTWVVGIDFGTHTCSAALLRDGVSVTDVPLNDDRRADTTLLPAFVTVTATGYSVGAEARSRARSGDPSTVYDLLRLVGRKVRDLRASDLRTWPFRVVAGDADKAIVEVGSNGTHTAVRSFHPEELVAALFRHIKQRAEAAANARVDAVVVAVPGVFNHTQRHAVRNACAIAGLRAEALVGAATAAVASLAIEAIVDSSSSSHDDALDSRSAAAAEDRRSNSASAAGPAGTPQQQQQQLVLAIDVGASCTDIALVVVRGNALTVAATDADLQLGGDDFTDRIAAHCRRRKTPPVTANGDTHELTTTTTADGCNSGSAAARQLRRAGELAKSLLSVSHTAVVQIDAPARDAFGCYTLSRTDVDALCADLWQTVLVRAHAVVRAGATRSGGAALTDVVLLGGSMHIPRLAALLRTGFGSATRVVVAPRSVTPARGAAVLSAKRGPLTLQDATPLALGIESGSGTRAVLVQRNAPLSVRETSLFYASCDRAAVVVRVLEGRSFSVPSTLHCLVSIPVERDRASSQRALQVELTFELASLDRVGVTVVERASGRRVAMQLAADETAMSVTAVARAHARLHGRITDTTELVLAPRGSVVQIPHLTGTALLSTHDPMQLLIEYVAALEATGSAAGDRTCASDGCALSRDDEALVHTVASILRNAFARRLSSSALSST